MVKRSVILLVCALSFMLFIDSEAQSCDNDLKQASCTTAMSTQRSAQLSLRHIDVLANAATSPGALSPTSGIIEQSVNASDLREVEEPTATPTLTPTFTPVPTETIMASPTATMTATPTLTPTEGFSCPGTLPIRLDVGDTARVIPGPSNNVRSIPSVSGAKTAQIPGGETFEIMDGPVCADGYVWWQVIYDDESGWTAQGDNNAYWIEPWR